jgi:putative transposase
MQCDFLGLPRSTYYHIPKGENEENLTIMQMMDKHIIEETTAGVLTMQSMLKGRNLSVSYERVRRLMRKANIRTIYPRKHLTVLGEKKYIYPYLLNNLDINRSNQVWK